MVVVGLQLIPSSNTYGGLSIRASTLPHRRARTVCEPHGELERERLARDIAKGGRDRGEAVMASRRATTATASHGTREGCACGEDDDGGRCGHA
jgi:hypothetical protein